MVKLEAGEWRDGEVGNHCLVSKQERLVSARLGMIGCFLFAEWSHDGRKKSHRLDLGCALRESLSWRGLRQRCPDAVVCPTCGEGQTAGKRPDQDLARQDGCLGAERRDERLWSEVQATVVKTTKGIC